MNLEFSRLISDVTYRKSFFDGMDHCIALLRDDGHYEAMKGYCVARNRCRTELQFYGIDD